VKCIVSQLAVCGQQVETGNLASHEILAAGFMFMSAHGIHVESGAKAILNEKATDIALVSRFQLLGPDQLADLRRFFLILDEWDRKGRERAD
jgi:hypothetical protein